MIAPAMPALEDTLQVRNELTRRRILLNRKIGEAEATAKKARFAKQQAETAEAYASACEEAARLMAAFADLRQEKIIASIEAIVSAGLSAVFGESAEIHLTQTTRARRPEIDITVKTGDLETPILDARGGGLAAVAGFLLKITTLLLTRGARKLIVADETLAHLSAEYVPRMAEFLAELCEKTGLQLIVVTHQSELAEAADRVIGLKLANGAAVAVVEK